MLNFHVGILEKTDDVTLAVQAWRVGLMVVWCCAYQQSCSTSSPVSTEMGDCRCTVLVCSQPSRPTQPPTLRRMSTEYQPKCDDALRLGNKGRYGSFNAD